MCFSMFCFGLYIKPVLRPFHIQSDSASGNGLFDWTFFGWNLLILLLVVSRVDFIVFLRFLEAVIVREYCSRAVEIGWQLCLCFSFSPRATARRTLVLEIWWLWACPKADKATFVELHSAEGRQSNSRRSRYWQHGINTARCCRRVMNAAGERNQECTKLTCCEKQQP